MVMWMAGIAAVLVVSLWFFQKNPYVYITVANELEEDLRQVSLRAGNACNTLSYYSIYNPLNEQGYIEASETELCISKVPSGELGSGPGKLRRCQGLPCPVQPVVLDLSELTYIEVRKDGNLTISAR